MNVAIVLFGQPRDYLTGYNTITQFCKNQDLNVRFEVFYHCWTLNDGEKFKVSPWRHISEETKHYDQNTETILQRLYNPVAFKYENQNNKTFDETLYKNTIAYNNIDNPHGFNNIDNILYQYYSRNTARNILHDHTQKTNTQYDFVILTRFDVCFLPELKLNEIDKTKTHVSNYHLPRQVLSDICTISSSTVFLEWFNIFPKITDMFNSTSLLETMKSIGEDLIINAEQIITMKYLSLYGNFDNMVYYDGHHII